MLAVYIELVVHLRSKSSCSVMFSFLSNASEVKDGAAVPFFCIIRENVSTRAGEPDKRLTIFCLQSSWGSLTKSSISFFHSTADRLNPAPGSQDGRYLTAVLRS